MRVPLLRVLIPLALLALCAPAPLGPAGPAAAAERGPARASCPEHFARGQPPVLLNPRLAEDARMLCYQAFAVLHSARTRTPLWAAEHLTAERVHAARRIPRDSEFHADPNLPDEERAELADYARSGYDRGHLAPSGDMPTPEAQQESFTLANMTPQAPELNRVLWEGVESAVRTLATRRRDLYVVTGPIFQGERLQALRNRVVVPTHLFKAVLDRRRGRAGAYVATNTEVPEWRAVSMAELAGLTGMDVFPALTPRAKQEAMRLPDPTPTNPGRRRN